MRRTRFLVATAAAAALLVGVASPGSTTSPKSSNALASSVASASDRDDDRDGSSKLFGALLTGAAEVPGPGDMDGAAAVAIRLNASAGRICVLGFATNQIANPTNFHIHQGAPTVAGPIVVDFTGLLPAGVGCVQVERKLARAIVQDPGGYYFNIHNADFQSGAVRGTLAGF